MANKNKGKVIQMLSPENYIRKKARTLPIYECWLNTDWEESGMATVVIARRHTNENITFCLYTCRFILSRRERLNSQVQHLSIGIQELS